jgi:RNA polymerase sigma-70 factor (ECF subfamily)
MMVPENRLITLACERNQWAAESLFRRYQDRIFGYLIRMIGDRELAEDAAQETFIRGFRSLKTYREQGSFKTWLFQIAHREGLRMMEKERRRGLVARSATDDDEQKTYAIADPSPLPTEILMHQEQVQHLESALNCLSDQEKQVVLLRLTEELPFKEIARITDAPLNTVLGRMHNGVKKLKQVLNQEGIEL